MLEKLGNAVMTLIGLVLIGLFLLYLSIANTGNMNDAPKFAAFLIVLMAIIWLISKATGKPVT